MRSLLRAIWQSIISRPKLAAALLTVAVALYAFVELADELIEQELLPYDQAMQAVVRSFHGPWQDALAWGLSEILIFPYILALMVPFLVYLVIARHYRAAFMLVFLPLVTNLVVTTLKAVYHRPRPIIEIIKTAGASFPSGHAAAGVVLYGLLGYITWRYLVRRRWARALTVVVTVLLILATGWARVYLGVHYPTDVLAGWATGAVILFGAYAVIEAGRKQAGD